MRTRQLAAQFEAYADWRRRLAESLQRLSQWLRERELLDAQNEAQVSQTLQRLSLDQLVVAFVAEFSRGKSELINALFFGDYGRRLLPSSSGRTTMCPTELQYTPTLPPSIRLLPIETRRRDETISQLRRCPSEWVSYPLELISPDRMSEALSEVSRTKRVSIDTARELGLLDGDDALEVAANEVDGQVEIPCWRHAIINFPHSLLQQGLVVLDTPGLNAIGYEPELTLNLLPNAHAVVFVLAADTGVTRTDVETWRRNVHGGSEVPHQGRFAVLNKIDTLWDGLRTEAEIESEIARQVRGTAAVLGIPTEQVYPVSAQKALLAKVTTDASLLERSRLPRLEAALSRQLLPSKRTIVAEATRREARALVRTAEAVLETRLSAIDRQLDELDVLRGRSRDVVQRMLTRAREERETFDRGLDHFAKLRNDLAARTVQLAGLLGLDALHRISLATRERIEGSAFSTGIRAAMASFFRTIRGEFAQADALLGEIHAMVLGGYDRFAAEQGLQKLPAPGPFAMTPYADELQRLERLHAAELDTFWNMISKEKYTLQRRFFETIATRMKAIYEAAGGDADAWLKRLLNPLENQVREHQAQLRRRVETIRRIHDSTETSESRIAELRGTQREMLDHVRLASQLLGRLEHIADEEQEIPLAANE